MVIAIIRFGKLLVKKMLIKKLSHKGVIYEVISIFFRESGLRGLFRGVDSKLLQSVLAAGFMFLAYEKVPQRIEYNLTLLSG